MPSLRSPLAYRQALGRVFLLGLLAAAAAAASPLCVDAGNPQYFYYGGRTIALVGSSAEYLCHIVQSADLLGSYCMFADPAVPAPDDYRAYIDELSAKGLNTFRVWVGLNHSPGKELSGAGAPYAHEQPFPYNAALHQWNAAANLADDATWDTTYLDHLYAVVDFARSKHPSVIVEVTLFDPWSGQWALGPWSSANVYNGTGFAAAKDFATLPPGTACAAAIAGGPRRRQVDLMQRIARKLNPLDNFYWEIANEPDVAAEISGGEAALWHDCMIQQLYSFEATLPNGHHLIGVNYHTVEALKTIESNLYPRSGPQIKIVNTHYVQGNDSAHQGALELIRNWHRGPFGSLDRIFGFNETKITPFQQTPATARAEAWEFMLNEGGVYDHLGYQWKTSRDAATLRSSLGRLSTFLSGLNLRRMERSTGNPPSWAPSLPAYPSWGDTTAPRIYWAALQDGEATFVLYLHHSQLSANKRQYVQPAAITRLTTLTLQPGNNGRTYTAQWIDPATGATLGGRQVVADGQAQVLEVPDYTYDIALKVSDGSTISSPLTCAPF